MGFKDGFRNSVMKKLQKPRPKSQQEQCAILQTETNAARDIWPQTPDSIPRTFANTDPAELDGRLPYSIPGHIIEHQDFVIEQPARQLSSIPEQLQVGRKPVPDRTLSRHTAGRGKKPDDLIARRDQNASAQNIRRLRYLIREKYRLDVYVWNRRGVQRAIRPTIMKKAERSDAILQEMIFIVNAWDEGSFSKEEWRSAQKIKGYIAQPESEHLLWGDLPPWDPERNRRLSEDSWERDDDAV